MQVITRIRQAVLKGQVTLVQVSEASGLSLSGVHYIVQRPDRDLRLSTIQALEVAAAKLLPQTEDRAESESDQSLLEPAVPAGEARA